jgi:predicted enzyme related to lactoylglutathione lyase
MAIAFKGDLTCALGVRNLAAGLDWLKEMLGCEVIYHLEDMGWAEVHSPVHGVTIGLSQVEAVKEGGGATLVFGVTDIEAARAELEHKGVRFDGETTTIPDFVKLATFFDPDGNTFMFAQSLADPS